MLKKRIIPCLDIRDGRTVKGINFVNIRDAGDPVELAERYVREGADELVFLDISATNEKRATIVNLVQKVARKIDVHFPTMRKNFPLAIYPFHINCQHYTLTAIIVSQFPNQIRLFYGCRVE